MPLSTYAELQTAILLWLARPGDPLLEPSVPDMIRLFEAEASRRLQTIGGERQEVLYPFGASVELPADFARLRNAALEDGSPMEYVPPQGPWPYSAGGQPRHFTIVGGGDGVCVSGGGVTMQFPVNSASAPVVVTYRRGLPPLSDAAPTNWLLDEHPDLYLFGSLVEARTDASVRLAFCWAHARRSFYEFYTSTQSPLAAEVLARIAKLYEIETDIRGPPPDVRQAVRQLRSRPLVEDLHDWLEDHLPRVPGWTDLRAKDRRTDGPCHQMCRQPICR